MPQETLPAPEPAPDTLVDLLRRQADRYEDKVAFIFNPDGSEEKSRLTYRELDVKARAIATNLQRQGAEGQRVLLMCRAGLDNITGFFGCLYAGAVPVPLDESWSSRRVEAVVPDARAGFVLVAPGTRRKIKDTIDGLTGGKLLRWCTTEVPPVYAEGWMMPDVDADTHAMLQYSSGSTRAPRASVLTHRNLMYNLETIRQAWGQIDERLFDDSATGVTGVSWLPHYHDMGLVGGALVPIDAGFTIVVMSPGAFLMRPLRWLEVMSRYRAPISAGPDFGYHWCVKRSTPEQRAGLDLSNWSIAITGGEPVRAATLRRFAEAFAPVGFRPEAFVPAYGLTEATLALSGVSETLETPETPDPSTTSDPSATSDPSGPAVFSGPLIHHIDRTSLGEDRVVAAPPDDAGAVALVGCGGLHGRHSIVIVDPETLRLREADEVGEIWITGPSVASGYWEKPEETEHTFSAFLADRPPGMAGGPYLRTGDLGFLRSGQLFITGRCKDLIIIGGVHYYPNDIEETVQECHPALLPARCAAFSVEPRRDFERLVVVQEVHRHRIGELDLAEVIDVIRAAIDKRHGIEASSVLLVRPQRIPTTSNAKVQRGQCKQLFLDDKLEPVAQWHAPPPPPVDETPAVLPRTPGRRLARFVATIVLRQLRERLEVDAESSEPTGN